jgi:BirA family biotin operon repressor/biotin-[acetyl-CoA-carboxylase] ligase
MYDNLARPPLSSDELMRALAGKGSRWRSVEVVESVESTNAVLAARVRAGDADEVVLLAEHQTAGRGRFDRSWVSPPRAGITMSVLLRPAGVPAPQWPWVTLLTGLAVAAAVQRVSEIPARLKWPNDVIVDDRKLAGLLAERVAGPAGPAVVMGIGLNVTTSADELPVTRASSLRLEGAVVTDRPTLVKAILRRLEGLLAEWEAAGGEPSRGLRTAYEEACATLGREVLVSQSGGTPVVGRAVGIDAAGRLLVDTPAGQQAFGAGDVTHVRPSA